MKWAVRKDHQTATVLIKCLFSRQERDPCSLSFQVCKAAPHFQAPSSAGGQSTGMQQAHTKCQGS